MLVLSLLLFYGFAGELTLKDVDGHAVTPVGKETTVFIFTRTDCPISNRYAPEVRRIFQEYAPRGVKFWLVYVDPKQGAGEIRQHLKEYEYPLHALLDPAHELVKLTHATITPEAAVYAEGRLVYRGRIDDRYVAFGKSRQSASKHDLEEVLAGVSAGRRVEFAETKSVGCFIEDLK